jgi:hypothetical protein
VIFVGVRARNLDACALQITASLRDPCTNQIVGFDDRPIDLIAAPDGWGEPRASADIASFANLPACPNAAASRDIHGQPYVLEVEIRDRAERTASASVPVTPFCADPNVCPCECRSGALRGQACNPSGPPAPAPACATDAGGAP